MDAAEARELLAEIKEIESHDSHDIADLRKATEVNRRVKSEADRQELQRRLESLGVPTRVAGAQHPSTVFDTLRTQNWEIGAKAVIAPEVAIGVKTLMSDPDGASILTMPGIEPEPADSRFVYPRLPISNPGDATSVQALVSQGRSLDADVADVASTAEKSVTDSTVVLTDFRMQRAATVSGYHPNALVGMAAFRQLVNDDLTTAYRQALDAYIVGEITDNAGTTDNDDASDGSLIGEIRVGQKVVQDAGLNPNLVIVGSQDALELDLLRSVPTGDYLLDPSPRANGATPLFGMSVVVGVGVSAPIVLDTSAVQCWIGPATFAADTTTEFSTNQSRFRLESSCLAVVRQPDGIYVVAAGSS